MKSKLFAVLALVCALTVSLSAYTWQVASAESERAGAKADLQLFLKTFPQEKNGLSNAARELLKTLEQPDAVPGQWIPAVFSFVRGALRKVPPCAENETVRLFLLHLLDRPVHIDTYRNDRALSQIWNQTVLASSLAMFEQAVSEIEKTRVPAGKLAVWKLYNMGFVVRSEHHTAAFDIYCPGNIPRGSGKSQFDQLYARLAQQTDIAFVSHLHGDHCNGAWLNAMKAAGKPVVIPDTLWSMKKNAPAQTGDPIVIYGDPDRAVELGGVTIRSLGGHQAPLKNSLYQVTLDGIAVLHCGDNTDLTVFRDMPKLGRVDLLLASCWSFNPMMAKAIRQFNAGGTQPKYHTQLCVTGHENELGHSPGNRESFRETYIKLGDRAKLVPTRVIDNGESVCWPSGRAVSAGGLADHAADAENRGAALNPWQVQFHPVKLAAANSFSELLKAPSVDMMGAAGEKAPDPHPRYQAGISSDGGTLYLRFVIPGTAPKTQAEKKQDAAVYDDDCAEIFLASSDGFDYFHIAVNADGTVYDSKNNDAARWNGEYTVQVQRPTAGEPYWSVAAAIPLAQFHFKGELLGNLCVLDKKTWKSYNASPSYNDFHDISNYVPFLAPTQR